MLHQGTFLYYLQTTFCHNFGVVLFPGSHLYKYMDLNPFKEAESTGGET